MEETKHTPSNPRYPDIQVQLSGEDGNSFAVMGRVRKALKDEGVDPEEIERFREEATAGDYNHLLVTCMSWVGWE